ncbi:MAG: lipid-A-disaccharide synthase [Leptolyngbya sp. UWPOB_LEPTO1]|uniref:lipid-A-disaccharide synthase n=1 Tax=Leptolyngbya sp. UWPOB_LEPTO1 TaxID=2815653 RepID=UPI001AD13184|nr:lipid-A-disaccharide synthase [Leptolyngbya sp. UWPOB_LEPTO1]MBN8560682.1 lipid-A-disaccharide synthase [Leptolyngbya sp. UWPOB_LEPTO1]
MKKRIFISTGEVSGDLQGSLLVKALYEQASELGIDIEILALGGDRMAAAGAKLLGNTVGIGSIGIIEGLPYLLPTLKVQKQAKRYLQAHPPDLVVMMDYSDPNISIGLYVRKHLPTIPTVYFIAPQEWVVRINQKKTDWIVQISDRILSIFPAEAEYYAEHGAKTEFVGHPLIDRMKDAPDRSSAREKLGISSDETAIVLVPASRQQEIKYMLPAIFGAAQQIQAKLPDVKFLIPLSLERYRSQILSAIAQYGLNAVIVEGSPLNAIAAADLAITKSGTVNLEIALLNVPQVVMYRLAPFTAWVAEHILKLEIPFASPPNLVGMKEIVPEFLQDAATPENLARSAMELLQTEKREKTIADYQEMRRRLGEPGACRRAAKSMLEMVGM